MTYDRKASQRAQDQVPFDLTINGVDSWENMLKGESVEILPEFVAHYGGRSQVPALEYLHDNAESNAVSFERCLMNHLLNRGYVLEELEVQFNAPGRDAWGKCTWYKSHDAYVEDADSEQKLFFNSLRKSMWKTEHAGDQQFSMFSMQMIGGALMGDHRILLHKTLLYRKAVFSPPKEAKAA